MRDTMHPLLLLQPFQHNVTISFARPADIKNVYDRARLMCRYYGLTVEDIANLTPRFWSLHKDHIGMTSNAAITLLCIHINLCMGTLAKYLPGRPDLQPLLDRLANFDINGQFMLTEVGHGLDAAHLETTATLQPNGCFILHTLDKRAAKYMPPSTPDAGMARGAVVFARLIVKNEDRGIRHFWVMLNDEAGNMEPGVISTALPRRACAQAVDHALTTFNHKVLPPGALLGSMDAPADPKKHFYSLLDRVTIGTLSLSMLNVPLLQHSAFIAAKYSMRRQVTGHDGKPKPIIEFRTQQRSILHALALASVFEAGAKFCVEAFMAIDHPAVRHGLAAAFKAAISGVTQETTMQLADRCGAQGLYEYNTITEAQMAMRGNGIAEGDVLVLSIRLASELIIGRYTLPPSENPSSLLATYESGLVAEAQSIWKQLCAKNPGITHRSEEFNNHMLPLALPIVEALGFRLAYDGACYYGVAQDLLEVFEAFVVCRGQGWFIENVEGLCRREVFVKESEALSALLPRLESLLDETGVAGYAIAPLLSQERWDKFVAGLPFWAGEDHSQPVWSHI